MTLDYNQELWELLEHHTYGHDIESTLLRSRKSIDHSKLTSESLAKEVATFLRTSPQFLNFHHVKNGMEISDRTNPCHIFDNPRQYYLCTSPSVPSHLYCVLTKNIIIHTLDVENLLTRFSLNLQMYREDPALDTGWNTAWNNLQDRAERWESN